MTSTQVDLHVPLPLEEGWTLPASWYSDEGVHALERERIFTGAWTYAGPAEWAREPGSFFASQVGHVPVAVVRGTDGTLRGFVNVCRHRGHLVVEGTGCRETLQCPYHAWTYDLDGSLRSAPRGGREPGFDRGGFSLLDTQFVTSHLAQFGATEVPRRTYKQMLRNAMEHAADWNVWPSDRIVSGEEALAAIGAP